MNWGARWREAGWGALYWALFLLVLEPCNIDDAIRAHAPLSIGQETLRIGAASLLGGAVTPVLLALTRRFPVEGPRRWRHLAIHLASIAVLAFGLILLGSVLARALLASSTPLADDLAANLMLLVYNMACFIIIAHALMFFRRAEERGRLLALAQIQALKAQLNPHFLYNTLNAVSEYAYKDAAMAERLIVLLSELLRSCFAEGADEIVPLASEIGFVRRYLEIQSLLLGDRLSVRYDIELGCLAAQVPNFLLQPLVENAVTHGVASRAGPGLIEIGARAEGAALTLWVRDNGPGPGASSGAGIGLAHTRARLEQLYGGGQRLDLTADGAGCTVHLTLPLELG